MVAAPVALKVEPKVERIIETKKQIIFNEMMTVKDLSDAMGLNVTDVIKKLLVFNITVFPLIELIAIFFTVCGIQRYLPSTYIHRIETTTCFY